MLNLKAAKPRGWIQLVSAIALVGALSACGGGDDPVVGAAAPAAPATPTTPATPVAPVTSLSSGIESTGNLNFLAFDVDGISTAIATTVGFTAPNGTLTLFPGPDALEITTTDSWATVVWPTDFSGVLRAGGNVALVCSVEAGQSHFVLVSHNMTAVPSNEALAAVGGKTFTFSECDGLTVDSSTFAFNSDGSITDGSDSLTAAEIASAFSAEGLSLSDGGKLKLSLYSRTVGGVTQYQIAESSTDSVGGVLTKLVGLASEEDAPR